MVCRQKKMKTLGTDDDEIDTEINTPFTNAFEKYTYLNSIY